MIKVYQINDPHCQLDFFRFCGDRFLNPEHCIYYALSIPTELNSQVLSTRSSNIGRRKYHPLDDFLLHQ